MKLKLTDIVGKEVGGVKISQRFCLGEVEHNYYREGYRDQKLVINEVEWEKHPKTKKMGISYSFSPEGENTNCDFTRGWLGKKYYTKSYFIVTDRVYMEYRRRNKIKEE